RRSCWFSPSTGRWSPSDAGPGAERPEPEPARRARARRLRPGDAGGDRRAHRRARAPPRRRGPNLPEQSRGGPDRSAPRRAALGGRRSLQSRGADPLRVVAAGCRGRGLAALHRGARLGREQARAVAAGERPRRRPRGALRGTRARFVSRGARAAHRDRPRAGARRRRDGGPPRGAAGPPGRAWRARARAGADPPTLRAIPLGGPLRRGPGGGGGPGLGGTRSAGASPVRARRRVDRCGDRQRPRGRRPGRPHRPPSPRDAGGHAGRGDLPGGCAVGGARNGGRGERECAGLHDRAGAVARAMRRRAGAVLGGWRDVGLKGGRMSRILAMVVALAGQVDGGTSSAVPNFHEPMTRPVPVKRIEWRYPPELAARHVSGLLVVACVLSEEGVVEDCEAVKPLAGATDWAIAKLKSTRYTPVTLDGKPVRVRYVYSIRL